MYLKTLKLTNFRNYNNLKLNFGKNINIIYGNNAVGKTNILEAIYISCITKSPRVVKDIEIIKFNKEYTQIISNFEKTEINFVLTDKNEKILKENDIIIKRLGDFIGKNLVVFFSPENMNIVKGSPQKRRKFIDITISQISKKYLITLQEYNKYLQIKNNLFKKNIKEKDDIYLDIIDEKLAENIEYIVKKRVFYINNLNLKSKKIHLEMTNGLENIDLKYVSDFENKNQKQIIKMLKSIREYDFNKKTSSKGINHDNILIYINEEEVSKYGSQGQNRTSLLTLKFAEFELLKEEKENSPIILLDDVFSELDNDRINYLLSFIKNNQVFITTTQIDNIKNLSNTKIFKVMEDGLVIEQK